jgi:hypothetical protein
LEGVASGHGEVTEEVAEGAGEALRSKTDRAMKNETLAKLVAWNITCVIHAMYELGIAPTMAPDTAPDVLPLVRRG